MSRFKMPVKLAPSPAAAEPGLQNAAARIRSSREAQQKLLEARRSSDPKDDGLVPAAGAPISLRSATLLTNESSPTVGMEPIGRAMRKDKARGEADDRKAMPGGQKDANTSVLPMKEASGKTLDRIHKLTILLRLPLIAQASIATMPKSKGLDPDYVLKSLIKSAREMLRGSTFPELLPSLSPAAQAICIALSDELTLGEPMTIYLSEGVIAQMHRAFGDPLLVYPKARVAGAYFSALIARLIEQGTGR